MTPQKSYARERFPTLRAFGIAAEFWPGYVNLEPSPHFVDVVLCSFVVRGQGQHRMGDEIHEDGPGCLSITHYGQEHEILTPKGSMDIINLFLDPMRHTLPGVPETLLPTLRSFLPLHPGFFNRCNHRVRLCLDPVEPAAQLLQALIAETRREQPGQREAMAHLLSLFLIRCCRQVRESGVVLPGSGGEGGLLEAVRRRLDEEPGEPHTLAELAALARMTPESLSRAFKRYTGKPVFVYLHQRRIERAAFLLRYTSDKVAHVALDCGFGDVSFFNRKFRAFMNCAPSQYRAQQTT